MSVLKGYQGKLYIGDYGSDATTEIDTARDVSLDMSNQEIDVAVRADNGSEATDTGVQQFSISVTLYKDSDDANYEALRAHGVNKTKFSVKYLDYENGPGFLCDAVVTGMQESQSLNDPQSVDFTIKRTRGQALTPIEAA